VSNPSVNETLAVLDALKSAVEDFARREEKLNGDFRIRKAQELKAFETSLEGRGDQLEIREAEASIALESAKELSQSRFEQRKGVINRIHSSLRDRIVEEISRQEAEQKEQIQTSKAENKDWRESSLAATDVVLKEFDAKIVQARETFAALETNAKKALRAYGDFQKMLADEKRWPQPDSAPEEGSLLAEAHRLMAATQKRLDDGAGGLIGALFKRNETANLATEIAGNLVKARRLIEVSYNKAGATHQQTREKIESDFAANGEALSQQWRETVKWGIESRAGSPIQVDLKAQRIHQRNERLLQLTLKRLETETAETLHKISEESSAEAKKLRDAYDTKASLMEAAFREQWNALEAEWKATVNPLCEQIRAANESADKLFPGWESPVFKEWNPPKAFANVAKFGQMEVDLESVAEALPKDNRLALPGTTKFSVPLSLSYPHQGSILFETTKAGGEEAVGVINNIIYRLLATTPPGKLSFTIFDPVGLGQNFAGLMHLADYEDSNINSRIWTQQAQLEEKLAELSEHMEKVIQMYLRNEYATITEYNAQAGTIAEKYHILVIASFPVNFSDTAAKRLRNIATSGARCGVYTLIHWDQRNAVPQDFVPDELRKNSVRLVRGESGFNFSNWKNPGTKLILDAPPSPEFATEFLHQVGERGKDSNRVEVPFAQIAPADPEIWSEVTTSELRVPIGRSGATKLQYLAIGRDTRQHALIAGKTGSGKSTLFHVIITNLALWCSPDEVEFYLVDFKKGVEFKCYANRKLPHARVVAIESDREFGLSVLQRIDDELRRRGDMFRKLGAQDVAGYKRAGGTEAMPRSLLIIDEFQEFFTEEDRISQGAAVLLDRIVRQGRAFGIHVLLGSQTLGGAYTLARATIGQMVIRIALQCNEADAYLIMDQDNPAPRLLSRPGEGIYNDTAGSIEGNSPFQAVWLSDTVRDDYLKKIQERGGQSAKTYPSPFVFEGNAPADVRENGLLNALLNKVGQASSLPSERVSASGGMTSPTSSARAGWKPALLWLGAPNSIKGPTEAKFQRQSGGNLLIVGQNDEATLSMLAVSLVSLATQYPSGGVKFVLLESTVPGSPERDFLDQVVSSIPHEVVRAKSGDVTEVMNGLAEDLKSGSGDEGIASKETFVLIHGLHNFKKLRQEDDFSFSSSSEGAAQPATIFLELIKEGPSRGIHVMASCDSYNNVNRCLGRKNLSEFEMRVLFQMSASDSATLIDNPDAATLGLHRALFYNDREGYLETFRPYARPGNDWIEDVASLLKTR